MKRLNRVAYGSVSMALAATFLLAAAEQASAQGMRYTAQPGVSWVQWDDALGLEDVRLNGGSVGLGFGRYVGLRGYYLTKDNLSTGFQNLTFADPSATVANGNFELASYGGELTIGLGGGGIVPIVMGGGGIMRFRPEGEEDQKRIELKYGAGLRTYLAEAVELEFMVERNQFRLNPLDLIPAPAEGDPALPQFEGADAVRRNLALRLGIGIQLGSRQFERGSALDQAVESRYRRPFSDLAISLQPFVGRQSFDNAVGLADRDIGGITAGLDFGSFVGLRGFYWEGVNDDWDGFEGFKGYGAEAQFNLTDGEGLAPYLVAGAGQMEFGQDFDSLPSMVPADQKALILGAGLDFNFGSRLRLTASARDYIMAGDNFFAGGDLERAATPDDIVHNWQFAAGLKLLVGGGRGVSFDGRPPVAPEPAPVPRRVGETESVPVAQPTRPATPATPATPAPVQPSPEMSALVDRMEVAAARAEAAADRAQTAVDAQADAAAAAREAQPDTHPGPVAPSHLGAPVPTAEGVMTPGSHTMPMGSSPYGPVVVVPMPWPMPWGQAGMGTTMQPAAPGATSEGSQLAPGLTADQLRELIRSEINRAREEGVVPSQPTQPGVTSDDLAAMEERLVGRMNSTLERERRITEEIAREEADAAVGRRVPAGTPEAAAEEESMDAPRETRRIRLDPSLGFPVREYRPYTGLTFGQGSQWSFGIAADWGPVRPGSRFDLVPELAVAFGSGQPQWMAAANLQYRTGWVFERDSFWINPLVQAGPGIVNRDGMEAVVNLAYGATIQLRNVRSRNDAPLNLFIAHQGIDLYDRSSLILGLSLER